MKLEYAEGTGYFILRLPRGSELSPKQVMDEHGFDLSTSASTANEAVLFTHEPYAAASFGAYATPEARAKLSGILAAVDASRAPTSNANIDVPSDKELWGFQKAGVEYALGRTHTLIGDQPGLGKTQIAIAYANEIRAKRVLVICPASIRLQWGERVRDWSTMPRYLGRPRYHIHTILHSRHGVHPTAEWTIVSYELARTPAIQKALINGTYDLLILDEAHYLKSIDSRRTRAIFGGGNDRSLVPIADRSGAILALTGTPLPNRPREAYVLSRNLCFDAIDWLSEERFRERFNPSQRITTKTGKFYIDERSGRHSELQNRLRANFMTRHLKRDVMTQLQLPIYDLVHAEATGAVKQALQAESLLDIDPETLTGADAEILGQVSTVRRMMGVALAPQVAEYVDMLLEGGEEKVVLFAWHKEVLDILQQKLYRRGVVKVDGSTSATQKAFAVNAFRTNPKVQVILGNVLSLGTGTDGLQHASNHAVIAEPDWVPGNNIQCFDRLDRGGQTRQVQGDIFVAPGSFAERVLAGALRKLQNIDRALDKRIA